MGLTLEEVVAFIKEAESALLSPMLRAAQERFGSASLSVALALASGAEEAANPFTAGLLRASEMPTAKAPDPLWYGMYPGRVTLLIGESGAGKSSLLFNVAVYAARGETLWGFGFSRPLRVLYVDPENAGNYREAAQDGGLCRLKLDRIDKGLPDTLTFHDGRGVDLSKPTHLAALQELVCAQRYDLVVLDPIANLFNTEDENSNAEAARHGKALTALSRETGACIVAAHHTGKDTGGNYGRGASARLGAADVGIVFRVRGNSEEHDDTYSGVTRERDDMCRVQIVKDRAAWFGHSSKYLRMAGADRFEEDTFESWKNAGQKKTDKDAQALEEVTHFLQDGKEHNQQQLFVEMQKEGFGRYSVMKALKELVEKEVIEERRGDRNAKLYQIKRESGKL
jgi:RecA-family ATPase